MTGREKLRLGEFNYMSQEHQPGGSVDIILFKRGEQVKYHLVVKNLYQPNEVVIMDEEIPV